MTTGFTALSYALAAILAIACAALAWALHRSRRLLREEQRWVSQLFDQLGIAHWRRNLDTQELWWSNVFRRMHGIAPDEPAERARSLRRLVPEDRQRLQSVLEEAYTRGGGEAGYRIQQPGLCIALSVNSVVPARRQDCRARCLGA